MVGEYAESSAMINETTNSRKMAGAQSAGDGLVEERLLEANRIAALTPATMAVAVMVALGLLLLVQLGNSTQKQLAAPAKPNAPQMARANSGSSMDRSPY
jgi:hypothetical protein